jgi:stage II sporulation protein D
MCLALRMRALIAGVSVATVLALAGPAAATTTVYVRGAGYGHGIGMSQYGAYGYALHGENYRWILGHYYAGTQIGATNPNQVVRVLLGSGSAAFCGATQAGGTALDPGETFDVAGGKALDPGQTFDVAGGKALAPGQTYDVAPLASGQLSVVDQSSGKQVGQFPAPLVVAGSGPLTVAGLGAYRGALEFRPNGSGGVYTVDALGLDDYVRGVISAEMPASWAPEALKAQAVAARTYAITTDIAGSFYNLYPDARSQVYGGVAAETPATDAAVAATAGQIVTYDGAPAMTYFFASSGGHTENIEDAWPGAAADPWLRGEPDPYDDAGGNPYYRWGNQFSIAAAGARLGRLVRGRLIGIKVTKTGASPRIMLAQVVGTGGTTTVTGGQLESAFSLPSTWASFTTISTVVVQPPTHAALGRGVASDLALIAQAKRLHGLLVAVPPAIRGSVFPARKGSLVTVEVHAGSGWRASSKVRLSAGGAFAVLLPAPGTYRVAYHGVNGPAVEVP